MMPSERIHMDALWGRRQALQAELEGGGVTRAQSSAEAAAALTRQAVTLKRAGKLQEARDVLRRAKAMEAQPAAAAAAGGNAGEKEVLESEFMALQAEVEGRGPAVQVVGELGGWADIPVHELLVDAGNSLSPSGVAADLNSPGGTHWLLGGYGLGSDAESQLREGWGGIRDTALRAEATSLRHRAVELKR